MEELQCWNICLLGFSQNERKAKRGEREAKALLEYVSSTVRRSLSVWIDY